MRTSNEARDAAATLAMLFYGINGWPAVEAIRRGDADHTPLVRAFADFETYIRSSRP